MCDPINTNVFQCPQGQNGSCYLGAVSQANQFAPGQYILANSNAVILDQNGQALQVPGYPLALNKCPLQQQAAVVAVPVAGAAAAPVVNPNAPTVWSALSQGLANTLGALRF